MGSAIRAHRQQSTQSHLDTPPPLFTAVKNVAFKDVAISERLRAVLDDLGALSPVCVHEKRMEASDRSVQQNRLLISYKGNSRSRKRKKLSDQDRKAVHFATMFSEKERPLVHPPEGENQDGKKKRRSKQQEGEDEERDEYEGRSEQQEEELNDKEGLLEQQEEERGEMEALLEQQEEADEERAEKECLLEPQEEADEERDKKKGKKKKNKEEKKDVCLDVQAYDRNGEPYHMKCRFLWCNNAYRIIGSDWRIFLDKNGLVIPENEKRKRKKSSPEPNGGRPKRENKKRPPTVQGAGEGQGSSTSPSPEPNGRPKHVRIELWAFRSRKLELGCTDQPDGALGLILLHYPEDGAEPEPERVDIASAAGAVELPEGSQQNRAAMASVHEMVMADAVAGHVETEAPLLLLLGRFTLEELGAAEGLRRLKHEVVASPSQGLEEMAVEEAAPKFRPFKGRPVVTLENLSFRNEARIKMTM